MMRGAATKVNSWAIVHKASASEKEVWLGDRLHMLVMDLDNFADLLASELETRRKLKEARRTR